jgi:hypothetical protein
LFPQFLPWGEKDLRFGFTGVRQWLIENLLSASCNQQYYQDYRELQDRGLTVLKSPPCFIKIKFPRLIISVSTNIISTIISTIPFTRLIIFDNNILIRIRNFDARLLKLYLRLFINFPFEVASRRNITAPGPHTQPYSPLFESSRFPEPRQNGNAGVYECTCEIRRMNSLKQVFKKAHLILR